MTVVCTEHEKMWLLDAMEAPKTCPFDNQCADYKTCRECMEQNIEFVVREEMNDS